MKGRFIDYFLGGIILVGIFIGNHAPAQVVVIPPPECNFDPGFVFGPPDPGVPGPFNVETFIYDFGDSIADLPDFDHPVEFRAEVHYPAELECGPFPIVFIMHGGHKTCFDLDKELHFGWPCPAGQSPVPNFRGYDYFSEILASHGFIGVSISANGINSADATNLDARAHLIKLHMDIWNLANMSFGSDFYNRVDMNRIGLLGHSRGGGAAALLPDILSSGDLGSLAVTPPNRPIKAVLLLAPVEPDSLETLEVKDIPLATVAPYCDGDQEVLPAVTFYDSSLYALPGDTGPKHNFLILGANHNFFNKTWDPNETDLEANDDWLSIDEAEEESFCLTDNPASGRLDSIEQRGTLLAIGNAFFRRYLQNDKSFDAFLSASAPPPPSAMTDQIFISYHPKDEVQARLDVNRLTSVAHETVNDLSGAVEYTSLERYEICDAMAPDNQPLCLTAGFDAGFSDRSPHLASFVTYGPAMLRLAWQEGIGKPAYINHVPEGFRDVSRYRAIQFRAFVDFSDPLNTKPNPQDLRIVLRDGAGLSSSVVVSNHSNALFFPPSQKDFTETVVSVPRAVLNTVRVPVLAFENIFLSDVRRIELVFDQTSSGAINITDLAFADEAANMVPNVSCSVAESMLMSGGDKLMNVGLNVLAEDDGTPPSISIGVYSDEDDLDSGNKQASPDAKDIAPNTLRLRGERDKDGDGRVYIIAVTAEDDVNALGHGCCTVTVPASNSPADMASIGAQADAALEFCTGFAAANEGLVSVPIGFFEVGDGPIIGQDQ